MTTLALLLAALTAATPDAPVVIKVALTNPTSANLDPKLVDFFTGQLAAQLSLQPGFQITTQNEMATLLGLERQKQMLGCAEGSCTAELAGALGVDAVIVGSLAKVGSGYALNMKALAAGTGRSLSVVSERASTEEQFIVLIDRAAKKLAVEIRQALAPAGAVEVPVAELSPAPASIRSRAWIPAVAGGLLLAGGATFLGLSTGPAKKLQDNDPSLTTYAMVHDATLEGKRDQVIGFTLIGVGAAAAVAGLGMFLFGADAAPAVAIAPTRDGAVAVLGGTF